MKIYRVVTGHAMDEYGYPTGTEIAKYFFDEGKAKAFYKTGEFTEKHTKITTTYEDGYVSVSTTGAEYFEREKKRALPNTKVELVNNTFNKFRFEEVEVEE